MLLETPPRSSHTRTVDIIQDELLCADRARPTPDAEREVDVPEIPVRLFEQSPAASVRLPQLKLQLACATVSLNSVRRLLRGLPWCRRTCMMTPPV